jgi:hypothetical protein
MRRGGSPGGPAIFAVAARPPCEGCARDRTVRSGGQLVDRAPVGPRCGGYPDQVLERRAVKLGGQHRLGEADGWRVPCGDVRGLLEVQLVAPQSLDAGRLTHRLEPVSGWDVEEVSSPNRGGAFHHVGAVADKAESHTCRRVRASTAQRS